MTKRPHYTLEEVLDNVLSDDDEDLDDPDEPMEGSDDDFSDLGTDDEDIDEYEVLLETSAEGLPTVQCHIHTTLIIHSTNTICRSFARRPCPLSTVSELTHLSLPPLPSYCSRHTCRMLKQPAHLSPVSHHIHWMPKQPGHLSLPFSLSHSTRWTRKLPTHLSLFSSLSDHSHSAISHW